MSSLGVVEKKVLGALLILSDTNQHVKASVAEMARVMGYKKGGGAITFALKSLEYHNYISKHEKGYKVLI